MINLPTFADVYCADGLAGRFTALVGDPSSHVLSRLVVQSLRPPFPVFLVPVDQVAATQPGRITLKCTREALHQMAPFEVEEFVLTALPRYVRWPNSWADPMIATQEVPTYVPVKRLNRPDGEIVVGRGTRVEATDGYAGLVKEVLLDTSTGQVAGFVLLRALGSDPREVTIPASQIKRVYENSVDLKLDRKGLDEMPAALPRR